MITFAKRNLLVFFKDKSSVFFSLFAVFIIIGLYALFLGDMMAEQVAGLENGRFVMDSWISAGLYPQPDRAYPLRDLYRRGRGRASRCACASEGDGACRFDLGRLHLYDAVYRIVY